MIALTHSSPTSLGRDRIARVDVAAVRYAGWLPILLFLAVFGTQLATGGYRADRAGYSDEASHILNGLLVRDYLLQGLGENPLTFGQNYYLHYPKIAFGMWPPLFHSVLGVWLLPGWPAAEAALFLLALVTAWAAWRLSRLVAEATAPSAGWLAAGCFVALPIVVDMSNAVMLDLVVAALSLEATHRLLVYWASGRRSDAAWFGLTAAACCLVKGNGLAIVLVPVAMAIFTGRWTEFVRPGLYLSGTIVLVLAGPIFYASYRLDQAIGDFGSVTPALVWQRVQYYSVFLLGQFGVWTPLILAGCVLRSSRLTDGPWRHSIAAFRALMLAAVAFHLLNPAQVAGGRYVVMAMGPAIGLGVVSLYALRPWLSRAAPALPFLAVATAVAVLFLLTRPASADRSPRGYDRAIAQLATQGLSGRRVAVVGNEAAEGALVYAAAARGLQPAPTLLRMSKLAGTDDWNGNGQSMVFASGFELLAELEALHVDYLIADVATSQGTEYWRQVAELLQSDGIERIGAEGSVQVFRLLRRADGPAKPVRVDLTRSLGRVLQR